jgi:hypothetical protein
VAIEIVYIPYVRVSKFLQGERGDMQIEVEWNIFNNLSPQENVKNLKIKNHLRHTWYGFKT